MIKSRSSSEKLHLTRIETGERITFLCRDKCSRNAWLRKLNEAKNGEEIIMNESMLSSAKGVKTDLTSQSDV